MAPVNQAECNASSSSKSLYTLREILSQPLLPLYVSLSMQVYNRL